MRCILIGIVCSVLFICQPALAQQGSFPDLVPKKTREKHLGVDGNTYVKIDIDNKWVSIGSHPSDTGLPSRKIKLDADPIVGTTVFGKGNPDK